MKKQIVLFSFMFAAIVCVSAQNKKSKTVTQPLSLTTEMQKVSYAIGAQLGQQLRLTREQTAICIDSTLVARGVVDAAAGYCQMTEQELKAVMQQFSQKMQQLQKEQETVKLDAEKARSKEFLQKNKQQKGVIETASGLQYKVVTMGTGEKPTAESTVKVHYHGTTIDGKVFDSSVQRGEPISFPLNRVIRGWQEGLQLMPVGSKFIFYIPSDLAYGDRGMGDAVAGGATLIFEVELLAIEK